MGVWPLPYNSSLLLSNYTWIDQSHWKVGIEILKLEAAYTYLELLQSLSQTREATLYILYVVKERS